MTKQEHIHELSYLFHVFGPNFLSFLEQDSALSSPTPHIAIGTIAI